MIRFTEKIIFITKLSLQITLLVLLLELFFNGIESVKDLTVEIVIIQFLIVFIFGLISDPLGTRVSKYNSALSGNSKITSQFSGFTKFIIYMLGLPLAGLMISPVILELMVFFGLRLNIQILRFGLFWLYGLVEQSPVNTFFQITYIIMMNFECLESKGCLV
mgnify:CR=1 FL=1